MTTELEEQFFKVFGIEPLRHVCYRGFDNCIDNDYNCHCHNEKPCEDSHTIYPEITDRKLLEMITSLANALCNYFVPCVDYYNLKSRLLYDCIQNKENEELQYNIQQLFKEA